MNAKYFRYVFQNVKRGMCFTASVADCAEGRTEELRFLYLSGADYEAAKEIPSSREQGAIREHWQLLVLADFTPVTVKRALGFLARNTVDQVVFPAMTVQESQELAKDLTGEAAELVLAPEACFRAHGAANACALAESETIRRCGQELRLFCLGTGCQKRIALYHGSAKNDPEQWECLLHVKPFGAKEEIPPLVDAANLNFEMQFVLFHDFMNCKHHNGKNNEYFVDGQLLVGSTDLAGAMAELKDGLSDVWRRVRFLGIPEGAAAAEPGLWELGSAGYAQYVAGAAETDAEVIKTVVTGDSYRIFAPLGESSGLCISGYYVQR